MKYTFSISGLKREFVVKSEGDNLTPKEKNLIEYKLQINFQKILFRFMPPSSLVSKTLLYADRLVQEKLLWQTRLEKRVIKY